MNISKELDKKGLEIVTALDELHVKLTDLARLEEEAVNQAVDPGTTRLPVVEIEGYVARALQRAYDTNSPALAKFNHDRSAEFAGITKIVR